jgi:predicted MFS family arabinose efflux permease
VKDHTYKNYLLLVLLLVLASNSVDRLALGLLLQDIKIDLRLSDTQLGLMSGIAFALFYSLMGIPIARWADRGNRVAIISTTTALWSVAVAACGMAANFVQLLLIRVGVAVGEAGCMPPAHSLIADHFTRAERPRAVSRYKIGPSLSGVVGYFLAGWLNELYGWRLTFVILGLPGLALATVVRLTLREPRHHRNEPSVTRAEPRVREVWTVLWSNVTFRHLLVGFSVVSFFAYGIVKWKPAFFIRSYGLQTGEVGTWFTVIVGLGGILGTYCGGELAARFATHNERLQLRAMAVAYCCFGFLSALMYLSPNHYGAFAFMAIATLGGAAANGPLFATLQTLVPPEMRAMAVATVYLFANLIGLGLGPLAVGIISDALRPWLEGESLRYALLLMCPGYVWGAWHVWRASRTITQQIGAAS